MSEKRGNRERILRKWGTEKLKEGCNERGKQIDKERKLNREGRRG